MTLKTGEKCTIGGNYRFVVYVDGTRDPAPTTEERVIPLDLGDIAPPVRSSGKSAFWQLIQRR